jgi:hypothetical protein
MQIKKMDFTIIRYKQLITALQDAGYSFQTFSEYLETPTLKAVILRHDVEKNIGNAVQLGAVLHQAGIKGTFFIRLLNQKNFTESVLQLAEQGHEIGYHYDDLTACKGNYEQAIQRFSANLEKLRTLAPVQTIVAEGAPLSKHDNRTLWQHYNYRDYGIIGEPYFDVDFSRVLYLTDTGRRWDGYNVSVRDKIPGHQERWEREGLVFHSTKDIIKALPSTPIVPINAQRCLSSPINAKRCLSVAEGMFTFHPQRWHPFGIAWLKELVLQRVKNVVKRFKVRRSS